ncbi:hypothetical protein P171DRAFT_408885 [Karstenula rhodostoma CBS 690.94]|uniref:S-adenosyl-L-methionine-dependent methyltransferase n=1 Tax=Karstenula rhodostoma CBS 690.94 TaxID=1392251 RepID=A0A9P4PP85_9PLEO|nr:hypothetical protein P171DRAFT_408885 [Karstenula rhodostoma CBS 690.94]
MPSPPWIQNLLPFPRLLWPSLLLATGIYHFIMTVLETIFLDRQPAKVLNLTQIRYKVFARLWTYNGAAMSQEMPGPLGALVSSCRGRVLDVGPGSRELLGRFNPEGITAMYGAEPAVDLHEGLLNNARKTGFGEKYHALLCGGEPESLIPALHKSGVLASSGTGGMAEDGIFDEICCLRVLCGVPRPRETIKGLYILLKPRGRMVICEHVVNPWRTEGSITARAIQFVYEVLGWSFFLGGCGMQRHTREYLREAGEWETFELQYVQPKNVVPYVVGELIKKR